MLKISKGSLLSGIRPGYKFTNDLYEVLDIDRTNNLATIKRVGAESNPVKRPIRYDSDAEYIKYDFLITLYADL